MSRAFDVAGQVADPELPVVTVAELGILRAVQTDGDRAVATITPTYAGCPALATIRAEVAAALRRAGWSDVEVVTELHPAWSTDHITESGRAKLAAAGVAPPPATGAGSRTRLTLLPVCPRCGSAQTEQVSRFGSTACTSLWRCRTCAEPFPHVKAI